MGVASRRRREREERRAAILDAAARVFQRKGLTAATMDEVAAEAELSKGTLYLYFKNKDDLFVALSSRVVDRVVECFAAAAESARSGIEGVAAMLCGYADIAAANPHQFRLVIAWLATGEAVDTSTEAFCEHRQRIEALVAHLTGAITRGQADGSIARSHPPLLLAGQLWAGMLGALMFHINADELTRRFPQPVDMSEFTTSFVDILLDGIRPREDVP